MPEYDEREYVVVVVAGSALRGQRGLRPVPQVGAGLAVCVEEDTDGLGFGEVVVADGFAAEVVVVTAFGDVVVTVLVEPVRVGCGACVGRCVACGFAVAVGTGGCVAGTALRPGSALGLSVTLTWRFVRSSPPNVAGITLSGSAWNPMNASMAVATVASMTMTMLDSSDPRWVF